MNLSPASAIGRHGLLPRPLSSYSSLVSEPYPPRLICVEIVHISHSSRSKFGLCRAIALDLLSFIEYYVTLLPRASTITAMSLRARATKVVEKCEIKHTSTNAQDSQQGKYLWSPDLAPIEPVRRTWGWYNYMNLWISGNLPTSETNGLSTRAVLIISSPASFNVNTWQLAGSYVAGGLAWWQGWLCIWAGYILTGIFVSLGGRMGAVYHISFPVAIRSSFGIYGSIWPVINRIVLAIIWYSVQSWIGGQ